VYIYLLYKTTKKEVLNNRFSLFLIIIIIKLQLEELLLDISGVLFKKEIILINAANFVGNKMNSNMLTKKKKPLEKL
jgi:hypothetical protein